MNLLSHLLPDRARVRLETWNLDPARFAITLTLQARRITARCPLCDRRSKRVHSRYERTLADLPWGAYAVAVRLRVRRLAKLRHYNPELDEAIAFAEEFAALVRERKPGRLRRAYRQSHASNPQH